jgi:integrin alpha FG-GAP repeat containing protein 1
VGFDCSINIAYNRQVPLCGTAASQYKGDGSLKCRGWGQLCLADENFEFSLESSSEASITALFYSMDTSEMPGC